MPKFGYSIYIAACGVNGPKSHAYGRVKCNTTDKVAIPSSYTILGPNTIETLQAKYKVATDAALLVAMDITDGITEKL